jgi:hypothetical protein
VKDSLALRHTKRQHSINKGARRNEKRNLEDASKLAFGYHNICHKTSLVGEGKIRTACSVECCVTNVASQTKPSQAKPSQAIMVDALLQLLLLVRTTPAARMKMAEFVMDRALKSSISRLVVGDGARWSLLIACCLFRFFCLQAYGLIVILIVSLSLSCCVPTLLTNSLLSFTLQQP